MLLQHVVDAIGLGQLAAALVARASRSRSSVASRNLNLLMVDPSCFRLGSRPRAGPSPAAAARSPRSLAADLLVKFQQRVARGIEGRRLLDRLPQEAVQVVVHVDGRVDEAIAAAAIGAHGNQVFVIAVGGQQLAHGDGRLAMLRAW